jgi:hypothetical protein
MLKSSTLLIAFSSLFLGGCGGAWQTNQLITPSSYQTSRGQIPRTVGKLRRLAVLPIWQQVGCGKRRPEIAIDFDRPFFKASVKYLSSVKGYEIISLDPSRYPMWLLANQNQRFLDEIAKWSSNKLLDVDEVVKWPSNSTIERSPGSLTESLLEKLRANESIDGLLVFYVYTHFDDNCRDVEPIDAISLALRSYRLSILETATSRPVWRFTASENRVYSLGEPWSWGQRSKEEYLFGDLDAAIPKLLTH